MNELYDYENPACLPAAESIVFIDLRLDFAFHLIFGTEGNEDLLLKLVQAILPERGIRNCGAGGSLALSRTKNAVFHRLRRQSGDRFDTVREL